MLLDYYVHGRGRGHASRTLSVLPALREDGHEVRQVFAGGDATDLLCGEPGFVLRAPLLPGRGALIALARRTRADARDLAQSTPDAIVSDGDQSAILGARTEGVPSVAVGHDLVFSSCELPPLSSYSVWQQRVNSAPSAASATLRVAVHFLPVAPRNANTLVARPELDVPTSEAAPETDRVVCYFRDANGEALVAQLRDAGLDVHVVDGSMERAAFRRELASAAAVVGSAGSNLLAECVLLGKPVLAVHKLRDHEQALNAALIEQANVGMAANFERLHRRDVHRFIARAQAGDFARVDLAGTLPPVSRVMCTALDRIERGET